MPTAKARPEPHRCFAQQVIGGFIDDRWCSLSHLDTLRGMPVGLPEEDPDWSALTLYADSEVSIVFTPFDTANIGAKVMTEPPSLRTSTAPPYRD